MEQVSIFVSLVPALSMFAGETTTLPSTAHPGHQEGNTKRKMKDPVTGNFVSRDVPQPAVVKAYNAFMGGVDKSDQYIAYHCLARKTACYWKTLFYHLLEVAVTNAYILYKWLTMKSGKKAERVFRDQLVRQIISVYGSSHNNHLAFFTGESFRIHHGSEPSGLVQRCAICQERTTRFCPDCCYCPHLCQTTSQLPQYMALTGNGQRAFKVACEERPQQNLRQTTSEKSREAQGKLEHKETPRTL